MIESFLYFYFGAAIALYLIFSFGDSRIRESLLIRNHLSLFVRSVFWPLAFFLGFIYLELNMRDRPKLKKSKSNHNWKLEGF